MGRDYIGVRIASKTTLEINFRYKGCFCRERVKLKPSPSNLARAERFRASVVQAIENRSFNYSFTFPDSPRADKFQPIPHAKTVTENFLEKWLQEQQDLVSSSTWKGYDKIVRNVLIPQFGQHDLTNISRKYVRDWVKTLNAGNKRISNILSVFRIAINHAIDDELLDANPLIGFKYKRNTPPKEEDDVNPFNIDEQSRILGKLEGQGRNLFQFAFWTGLRTSELVALDWTDIDLERGVCIVRKALTQGSSKAEKTKTTASTREVKLLPIAIAAVNDQKQFTFLAGKEVFQNPRTLDRWEGDQAIREGIWHRAIKLSGVIYRRPYQTRHTYASMMLSAGENPMWVAKQMGHTNTAMLNKHYGRWMPDAHPEAGDRAALLFGAAKIDNQQLISFMHRSQ